MSIINITEPYHERNDHHIKLLIVYKKPGPLVVMNGSKRWKKAKKMIKATTLSKL